MPGPKDYTGMKFGKLTAIAETEKSNSHHDRLWLFQCECGEIVERSGYSVSRTAALGNIPACKSCAAKHKRQFMSKDYAGIRFGKLTAVNPTDVSSRHGSSWLFQCDCGIFVERKVGCVQTSVHRGNIPACPNCRKRSNPPRTEPKRLDIAGQKFGKLIAIRPTEKVDHRRYVIWEFQCECGDIVEKSAGYVLQTSRRKDTRTVSCGKPDCQMHKRLPASDGAFNRLYASYRKNAEYRNLPFELTKDQARFLFQQNCFYCGVEPSSVAKPHNKSHAPPFIYNGIDRLNNELGYVEGNVVACCWKCNRAKGSFTYEEYIEWIQRLIQHHR
jgi:hypothetical protein